MKAFAIASLMALCFAIPASSTDNLKSPHISGTVQVAIYANGLAPGGQYTPEWLMYKNDGDTSPSATYFRSPVTADASGYLQTSVPLDVLDGYGDYIPYVIEMKLLQPDPVTGFLKPVYDSNGHEFCTRVDVWEYSAQDNCLS